MSDLDFQVESVEVVTFSVAPLLSFKLKIRAAKADEYVQSVALRCQIMVEPARRKYSDEEQKKLFELFGEPARWNQTLKAMLWTHASVVVPPFEDTTTVDLPVACTFDFNVAATKYFAGLEIGEIPLLFLFSGTMFYESENGNTQIRQISWEREAKFRLPVAVWKKMMDHYYPNSAWLNLQRGVFEKLQNYKMQHGLPTFEQALEKLLSEQQEIKKSVSL